MQTFLRTLATLAVGAAAVGAGMASTAATSHATRPTSQIRAHIAPAQAARQAPQPLPKQASFDRFIIKYHDDPAGPVQPATTMRRIETTTDTLAAALTDGLPLQLRHVRRTAVDSDIVSSNRPLDGVEAETFLAHLRTDPRVAYAQPDHFVHPLQTVPDDPRFEDLQWDMHHFVGGVNAPEAWDASSGEGVVVAVLDTGYLEHIDLSDNIVPGYDFISAHGQTEDGTQYPDIAGDGDGRDPDAHDPGDWVDESMADWCPNQGPSSWHGTHVAGTVAAVANNGLGIAGLAHGAQVQPVRVMGHCGGLTSDIVDAVVWASGGQVDGVPDNPTPAEVLNLSLGSGQACSANPAMQEAIDQAVARGVSVVVAAGNSAQDAANYTPASCAGVIAVAATGVEGGSAFYTNYGPSVSLAAPGGDAASPDDPDSWIWSLGNTGQTVPVPSPEGDVLLGSVGTSMAAPHVAGAVALMQSAAVAAGNEPLTPAEVKAVLKGTVKPFGSAPPGGRPIGPGILDAAQATAVAAAGFDEADLALPLGDRIPATDISGEAAEDMLFKVEVPAGAASLTLRSYGGVGDATLYAAHDRVPGHDDHDGMSQHPGNTESITIPAPAAGTYFLRLRSDVPYRNVSVLAVVL